MASYVEVAVALPLRETFHYAVPMKFEAEARVGARVLAPFGRRGVNGVVVARADTLPEGLREARELERVLTGPTIPPELLELCKWVASYYEAPLGEVLQAAAPAASRAAGKECLVLTANGRELLERGALPKGMREVLWPLSQSGGAVTKARLKTLGLRKRDVEQAVAAGWAEFSLRFERPRVSHKRIRVATLKKTAVAEDFSRAPKRWEVVKALADAGGELAISELAKSVPRAAEHVRSLQKEGWVEVSERDVAAGPGGVPMSGAFRASAEPPVLTAEQNAALERLTRAIEAEAYAGFLLHGITGSGKTEVYLHAIKEVVARGKTALVLVPEISLTPQLFARFRMRFGEQVAVLHSGLTDRERFDEWHRLASGEARIVVGARSAVFAPIKNVGIIVVDEEHDSSFKQEEGVRYQGRDVALVRAQRSGAVCVLGSATPSMESYQLAADGRLELLRLAGRATAGELPAVELVDLRKHRPDADSFLTARLRQAVVETLERGEQVILFLNRRGFHTFVVCVGCGHAFRCPQCSVSLTFHRGLDALMCHYCGHREKPPEICPSCDKPGVARRGLGTERVADAIVEQFPGARVARLDRDTVQGGRGMQAVLEEFAMGQADILIGTQMVTKGHDFPRVTLVGVLCADTGLSLPDFRASEKTFQLITQVAGRAGRGSQPGRVLVQTYRPEVPAIRHAGQHDYLSFAEAELAVRKEVGYPPFGFLAAIRVDGTEAGQVEKVTRTLAVRGESLRARTPGVALLGPSEAPLARLKGRTRWHLWVRAGDRNSLRRFLRALAPEQSAPDRSVRITLDIDPVSAL